MSLDTHLKTVQRPLFQLGKKETHIYYEVNWYLYYSYISYINIMLLNGYFNFLTRYIVDGYVKKATRSLDLYSHGFKSLNTVSNKKI